MKKGRRIRTFICTMMVMMWVILSAVPALASPRIKDAEYEGNGKVEVDFRSKVNYKNVKVTVKDNKGAKYSTKIVEKDSDDLTFVIKSFKKGRTYTYTIAGVKKTSEKNYGQVTGKIAIPAATSAPTLKKADYDREDREVEFEFKNSVDWKNPKVTISDGKKNYVVRILEKDRKSIEVKVNKLTYGKKYTYRISGIRVKGNGSYRTMSGSFIARNN